VCAAAGCAARRRRPAVPVRPRARGGPQGGRRGAVGRDREARRRGPGHHRPGRSSGEGSIRILRPYGVAGARPVILYSHGAGWVFGNAHTHDRLIRELAAGSGAAVVFPNYSLSPEARHPTASQESYAALTWVVQHGREHGLDASTIAVAGDSVGGNMSGAITLMAKKRPAPTLCV